MTTPMPNQGPLADVPYGDLPGADSQYFAAGAGGHQIVSGRGHLLGWSIHDTSGTTPSLCYILDGNDTHGQIIGISRVNVNIEETEPIPWPGVAFQTGLFVNDASGLAEGVIWFAMD